MGYAAFVTGLAAATVLTGGAALVAYGAIAGGVGAMAFGASDVIESVTDYNPIKDAYKSLGGDEELYYFSEFMLSGGLEAATQRNASIISNTNTNSITVAEAQLESKAPRLKMNLQLFSDEGSGNATGTYRGLVDAGQKDAHHIIQDAAMREIDGYNRFNAPSIQLNGPSTTKGTPHNIATSIQRQSGGGTYGAERRIGYKALRRAGVSADDAKSAISGADKYFMDELGLTLDSPTRIPGNRRGR